MGLAFIALGSTEASFLDLAVPACTDPDDFRASVEYNMSYGKWQTLFRICWFVAAVGLAILHIRYFR